MKLTSSLTVTLLLISIVNVGYAKRISNVELKDLSGHTQKFDNLRGSITVLSFWATWCAPCREELPRLSKLSQDYSAKGVRFIAVSVDEAKDRPKIEPFIRQQNINLDVWVGGNSGILDRVGLGNVVPGTIVIDKDNEVIGRIMGEAQDADITIRLDWLLQGRQGPAPEAIVRRY
jgi:thiol-disulfide isomerase/thioredoxin